MFDSSSIIIIVIRKMNAIRLRELIKYSVGGRTNLCKSCNLYKSLCTKSQQPPIGMDFFDNEYYGLMRYLMASIGLWPYQKPERRVIRVFCVSFILVQAVLLQVSLIIEPNVYYIDKKCALKRNCIRYLTASSQLQLDLCVYRVTCES